MGVVLFCAYSLSLVGRNTHLKVNKDVKVSELPEMMPFDKEFDGSIHFLTNFIVFQCSDNIGPTVKTAYLYLRAKHHPTYQACKLIPVSIYIFPLESNHYRLLSFCKRNIWATILPGI